MNFKVKGLKILCHVKAVIANQSFIDSHDKNSAYTRGSTAYNRNGYVKKFVKGGKNSYKLENLVRCTNTFLIYF